MLVIRLIKIGRKNNPSFRIVLTEKTAGPQSGKFLEILGNYNPYNKKIDLDKERIKYWISKGAKPSETAHNLFVKQAVIKGSKIKKKIRIKKKIESKAPTPEEVEEQEELTKSK